MLPKTPIPGFADHYGLAGRILVARILGGSTGGRAPGTIVRS
jgi:hypothetical protein